MRYRFIKVTSYYKQFLHLYYRAHPEVTAKSYSDQHQHLMAQGYGYSNYFPLYLERNYSINGHELIQNARSLQDAWAKEHGSELSGSDLLLEQFKYHQPEILFLQDSINYSASFIKKVREEVKSVRLIIGHCCTPYTAENVKALGNYDVVLACSEKFVNEFRANNINSHLFPHALEASLIEETGEVPGPLNEIIFMGSLFYGKEFHRTRISYIEEILRNDLPLRIFGLLEDDPWHILKVKQSAYLMVNLLNRLGVLNVPGTGSFQKIAQLKEMPRRSRYSAAIKNTIIKDLAFGKEMLKRISGYAVGFNLHSEVAGDYAANVRMFEVTGAGSLLVTDQKKNINSLFEPDSEILTYQSAEECIEKLTWAIEHPAEARAIARAGQRRTQKDHSVEKRVDLLHDIIRELL